MDIQSLESYKNFSGMLSNEDISLYCVPTIESYTNFSGFTSMAMRISHYIVSSGVGIFMVKKSDY